MKITFLGGGNMASALIGGLLKQGCHAADIEVVEIDAGNRERLTTSYGVFCHSGPESLAWAADVIVLAVKPQQMKAAVAPLVPCLSKQVVVSIAAGLRLEALSRWLALRGAGGRHLQRPQGTGRGQPSSAETSACRSPSRRLSGTGKAARSGSPATSAGSSPAVACAKIGRPSPLQ